MSNPRDAYSELLKVTREIRLLSSASAVLHWDEQTQLPPKGSGLRAEQSALLARMVHEMFTSKRVGELISAVENSDLVRNPESDEAANLHDLRRDYDRATRIPSDLVEEMARTEVLAQKAWAEARKKSEWKEFDPWLTKMMSLKMREAECVGYKGHPYNAMLDVYEPHATIDDIKAVFSSLRDPLVTLVHKVADSKKVAPVELLERKYPVEAQKALCVEAAKMVGYDFDAGRLDIAVHPFATGIGPGDTRITTRYNENDLVGAFFGTLHEAGHAMYEQGLPKEKYFGQAIAESISLGIHESQSRMWENLVGRSRAFWKFFMPKLRAAFPDTLKDVKDDDFVFAINGVTPSFIRTESDETTYNLHILLRFELEQMLINKELKVSDVPAAWNERVKKYLGITPSKDSDGCLQDVHWSAGLFGYFPTYTLGNLYAAQFFEQARKDLGDLDAMFTRGEFKPLLGWLREKIHRHGRRYSARDLCKRVTGAELSAQPLLNHLNRKAAEFYGI